VDLVARAKGILTAPRAEWPVIAGESTGTAELYAGYVAPLAAITPVASILGNLLFNGGLSFSASVVFGVIAFAMALASVYVLGLIASKIAPSFGGKDDLAQGLKLVAYGYTASWVAGIFSLIPALALISTIGGLYSLYILYTGTSVMMGVPQERSAAYTAVVILVAIGLYIVIATILGAVIAAGSLAR